MIQKKNNTMTKPLLIIAISSFLISCAENPLEIATSKTNKTVITVQKQPIKNIKYTCNRETQLSVNFTSTKGNSDKNIAIINGFGSKAIILPNKTVASGFLYTNGKYSLSGKGKQATWSVGRMAPFNCFMGDKPIYQEDLK